VTICIGSICEDGKKAIIISDRMITDDDLSIEFEHPEPKILQLSKNCMAVTSGSALFFQEILEPVLIESHNESPKISEIVEKVAKSYSDLRRKRVEELYFRPMGFTIENFYKCQNERIVEFLGRKLDEFEFPGGLEILIIGVDEKAHIYLVDTPGIPISLDAIGWGSIGTGYPHAENAFIANKYHTKLSFNQAVYFSHEAKRRAEVAPRVGKVTDIFYIDRNGIRQLSAESIEKLNGIFNEKEKLIEPIEKEINEKIYRLSLW